MEQQQFAPGVRQQYVVTDSRQMVVAQQPMAVMQQPVYGDGGVVMYGQQGGQFLQQPQMMPQLMRAPRPPNRADAECYFCGVRGHFSRDKMCLQPDIDAYQASKRGQIAAGGAGMGQPGGGGAVQLGGGVVAVPGQAQIAYVPAAAGANPAGSG
jgi:hypothetical protein